MTCVAEVERILGGFPLPSGYDQLARLMCGWGYQPFPIAVLIAWLRDTSSRNRTALPAQITKLIDMLPSTPGDTLNEKRLRRDLSNFKELALLPNAIPDDWTKILALAGSSTWTSEEVLSLLSAFQAGQVTPLNATTFVANLTFVTPAPR